MNAPFNPVFGGAVAFFGTVVALYLLILLLYTTINQMRPLEIIEAIHDHVLAARQYQEKFLTRTRRTSRVAGPSRACVRANRDGFVTAIDLNALDKVLSANSSQTEVVLLVSFGSNVAFQSPVAEIKTIPRRRSRKFPRPFIARFASNGSATSWSIQPSASSNWR